MPRHILVGTHPWRGFPESTGDFLARGLRWDIYMIGEHMLMQRRTASLPASESMGLASLLDELLETLVQAKWTAELVEFHGRPAVAIHRAGMTVHVVRESFGSVALWREGTLVTPPEIAGLRSDPGSGWVVTPEGKDALLVLAETVVKLFAS